MLFPNSCRLLSFWCFYVMAPNPLHSNISIHILVTRLFTFLLALIRRIRITIKSFFSW